MWRALPRDLGPRRPGFVARDDNRLNDDQHIVAEAEQKTGQQREGMVAHRAIPALDADPVGAFQVEGFAPVEAVPDERRDRLTRGALRWTGENQSLAKRQIFLDSPSEVCYNHHVVKPDPKDVPPSSVFGPGCSFL